MFDPTAFENMKVVLEGALYDRDLDGEIMILDRNDYINSAKLSRTYEITFADSLNEFVKCTVLLKANLENLAAELLPTSRSESLSGSHISILFTVNHLNSDGIHKNIQNELQNIWGRQRSIQQSVRFNPLEDHKWIEKEIRIDFNRLVFEDQIDDLVEMVDYMILSLEKLQEYEIKS